MYALSFDSDLSATHKKAVSEQLNRLFAATHLTRLVTPTLASKKAGAERVSIEHKDRQEEDGSSLFLLAPLGPSANVWSKIMKVLKEHAILKQLLHTQKHARMHAYCRAHFIFNVKKICTISSLFQQK